MKTSKHIIAIIFGIVFSSFSSHSQIQNNEVIAIEEVYNHIIIHEVSETKECWPESPDCSIVGTNQATSIFLFNSAIVKNLITDFKMNWEFVVFSNVRITEIDKENILVTGFLTGKNFEKGMVNYLEFQHNWIIQNGIPIKIIQQSNPN
ncbi:MAG TPA: hypothetical protein VKY41_07515 [Xanthomarina sp.]|nr:hypothetical protein [Xanthomarina sp.]